MWRLPGLRAGGHQDPCGVWGRLRDGGDHAHRRRPRPARGRAGYSLCRPGWAAAGRYAGDHPSGPHQGLHRQRGEVPPASEPGPSECRAGRLHRLSAAAGSTDEAQDHRLPGPHRRQSHHQRRFQDHPRARSVVPAGRRPDDGHLSPGGAAAGRAEAPGDLSGFKKHSGQGPGAVRVY